MLFLDNLNELTGLTNNKLKKHMICYVVDITGIDNEYIFRNDEELEKDFSHYFILENPSLIPPSRKEAVKKFTASFLF
jgi:hypothetical protein